LTTQNENSVKKQGKNQKKILPLFLWKKTQDVVEKNFMSTLYLDEEAKNAHKQALLQGFKGKFCLILC